MVYAEMFDLVKTLEFDTRRVVCTVGRDQISLLRPSNLGKRFENYDVNKNFQIFLHEGERVFRPNHLRVMIDLNLRVRGRPDLKHELLRGVDAVFYDEDPDEAASHLRCMHFEHFLNDILVILNLSQLFLIEQRYNYTGESKYDPPTLFYQGWVRQFIDGPKEIDNLCMSVANRQPPSARYTSRENKKSKTYEPSPPALWYLE